MPLGRAGIKPESKKAPNSVYEAPSLLRFNITKQKDIVNSFVRLQEAFLSHNIFIFVTPCEHKHHDKNQSHDKMQEIYITTFLYNRPLYNPINQIKSINPCRNNGHKTNRHQNSVDSAASFFFCFFALVLLHFLKSI